MAPPDPQSKHLSSVIAVTVAVLLLLLTPNDAKPCISYLSRKFQGHLQPIIIHLRYRVPSVTKSTEL